MNEGGETKRVEVPVEMPDGVSYEGVFGPGGVGGGFGKGAQMRSLPIGTASSVNSLGYYGQAAPPPPPAPASRQPAADAAELEEVKPAPLPEPEAKPLAEALQNSAAAQAKLDAELKKLLRGEVHRVSVQDGMVKVYATLDAIEDAHLDALKQAGFDLIAVARSGNRIMMRAPVEKLVALAEIDFVVSVEPVTLTN